MRVSRPRAALFALALPILFSVTQPGLAQSPGWQISPLPGEGDRASLGCARNSDSTDFTCLAVRCEDDFSIGIHIYDSQEDIAGTWEMTLDRENRHLETHAGSGPYGPRLLDPEGWLLDRLRHGTFVYLRPAAETERAFAYIDLNGSFQAIAEALYWCAPRVANTEQSAGQNVDAQDHKGEEE